MREVQKNTTFALTPAFGLAPELATEEEDARSGAWMLEDKFVCE